jgi:hypothetical protein
MCTNAAYAAKFLMTLPKFADGRDFVPAAVGLNCGIYEVDMKNSSRLTKNLMAALLPNKGDAQEMDMANPIPYINEKFPRAFVMTANRDGLAGPPAQVHLVEKLASCGVPYVDKTYGTEEAPLNHVFHCNIKTEEARICNDEECAFFLQ